MKQCKRVLAFLLACALLAGLALFPQAVQTEEAQAILDVAFCIDETGMPAYRAVIAPEFVRVNGQRFYVYTGDQYVMPEDRRVAREEIPDAGICLVLYLYYVTRAQELVIRPGGLVRADGSANEEIRFACALQPLDRLCDITKTKSAQMVETGALGEFSAVEGEIYHCEFPYDLRGDVYYGDLSAPVCIAQGVHAFDVRITGSGRQVIRCEFTGGPTREKVLTAYTCEEARDALRSYYIGCLTEALPLLPLGLLLVLFPLTILPGAAILGGPLEGITGLIRLGALYRADCDNLR